MKPMLRERHLASGLGLSLAMSWSPTTTLPEVGRSMPPIRLRSVVLPLPDGPMSAAKSPSATVSVSPSSTGIACWSR